jgi:hypothetical protein
MAMEQIIDMPENGVALPAAAAPAAPEMDKYDEILEKIENPNCPVADVSRLISIEIAKATRDMAKLIGPVADPTMAWKSKAYAEHIKALRELSKQLSETDVLSKKDVLNMEGPKFGYVMHEIAKLYKKALKEAGCEVALVENAMRHFADSVSMETERIRREMEKIDSSKQ